MAALFVQSCVLNVLVSFQATEIPICYAKTKVPRSSGDHLVQRVERSVLNQHITHVKGHNNQYQSKLASANNMPRVCFDVLH